MRNYSWKYIECESIDFRALGSFIRIPRRRLSINYTPMECLLIDFPPTRASRDRYCTRATFLASTPTILSGLEILFWKLERTEKKTKKEIEVDRRVNKKR